MKFEDAIPQPLAHTIHGMRYSGGVLGHHFDIHSVISFKKVEQLEEDKKRRIKIMSGETSFDLGRLDEVWGTKGKRLHRRKSMIALEKKETSNVEARRAKFWTMVVKMKKILQNRLVSTQLKKIFSNEIRAKGRRLIREIVCFKCMEIKLLQYDTKPKKPFTKNIFVLQRVTNLVATRAIVALMLGVR